MYHDLTKGNISRSLLLFALPMMAGNLLQQFYNIADTLIVGRVLGRDALAAVGSAYTLMTFLTSIFLGLSLGSGALFSIYKGRKNIKILCISCLCADHGSNSSLKYPGLSGTGWHSGIFKGAGRGMAGNAPVSVDHLCRPDRNIPL